MSDNHRGFASLSSGLLARKGTARPAMRRPQALHAPAPHEQEREEEHDDLGWNDMGYDVDPPKEDSHRRPAPVNPLAAAIPVVTPEVKRQQDEIAAKLSLASDHEELSGREGQPDRKEQEAASVEEEVSTDTPSVEASRLPEVEPDAVEAPISIKKVDASRSGVASRPTQKGKVAFTLRLDAERHLRLRLATAIEGVSAQKFVARALDRALSEVEELDAIIEHMPDRGMKNAIRKAR